MLTYANSHEILIYEVSNLLYERAFTLCLV